MISYKEYLKSVRFSVCRFVFSSKFLCVSASLWLIFAPAACSVPKMEEAECSDARTTVREFYSNHFAGEMKFTPENLKERRKFLTDDLVKTLPETATNRDPFTLTDDLPRAFRVGGCEIVEPQKRVGFGVLLFWKTDTRTEQREIRVEAVRQADKWLIDKISN